MRIPSYKNFNRRVNQLNPAFPILLTSLVGKWQDKAEASQEFKFLLTDSMPVITCAGNRSGKVARSITDKAFKEKELDRQ